MLDSTQGMKIVKCFNDSGNKNIFTLFSVVPEIEMSAVDGIHKYINVGLVFRLFLNIVCSWLLEELKRSGMW